MNTLFHVFLYSFIGLSIVFLSLGIYALDFSLITISALFAISALLIGLENKEQLQNPFRT